jgi:hypothetical protein
MNSKRFIRCSCGLALVGLLVSAVSVMAQTSLFTYQGRLTFQGYSANGNYDLTFKLFDALENGSQIGSPITNANLSVSNGLFTVSLDFGSSGFPGADRWLELGVRTNGSSGDFATLAPRQQLTAAPYAVKAAGFTGSVQDSQLSANVAKLDATQTFTGQNTLNNAANAFTGSGAALTSLNADNISSGTLADARLSSNVPKLDQANTFTAEVKATVGGVDFFMVPKGAVVLWSGSSGSIPSGWALCNGANGTPDLRDKFVVGAGSAYAVGATGGATSHTHDTAIGTPTTASAGAHSHTTATGTTGTGTTGTGTSGSEAGHTHSVDPPSSVTGSAGSHTHGGGSLDIDREVNPSGSGHSCGSYYLAITSGTSAQLMNVCWNGSSGSGGTHTHTINIASFASGAGSSHSHSIPGLSVPGLSIPALETDSQGAHTHTVSIGTITSSITDSRPPYYALCYIMKL